MEKRGGGKSEVFRKNEEANKKTKTIQEKWGKKGTKKTKTEEEKKQARKKVEEGRSC